MSDEVRPEEEGNGNMALDLNFAPSWARTAPEENMNRYRDMDFDAEQGDGRRPRGNRDNNGRDRRPRRDFDRDENSRRQNRDRPQRSFRRDAESESRRFTPREDRRDNPPRRNDGPQQDRKFAENRTQQPRHFERRYDRRPEYPPLPLEIRLLPESKALGSVIRHVQSSLRAFPLRDIANLFLDKPGSCLLRMEALKDQQKENQITLFQCKICGLPALSEEEIKEHLLSKHLGDFFDIEDIDCEPPSGVFNCVARCGLSGELLGPPNHHSFRVRLREMLSRYPEMTEEAYRARIEMVREPEVIEQWRQQCTKKRIYRRKIASAPAAETAPVEKEENAQVQQPEEAPKAPPMEREVAEAVFNQEILPGLLIQAKHLTCPLTVAKETPSRPLFFAVRDLMRKEQRGFPHSLFLALRGAFRHRKLYLFRIADPRGPEFKGPEFVMLRTPTVLSAEQLDKTLQNILQFVSEHPGCTKTELVAALNPDKTDERTKEIFVQLAWLVDKGHIIHYYNDVLCAPMQNPVFRLLPEEEEQRRQNGRKTNAMAASQAADATKQEKQKPAAESTEVKPAEEPAATPPATETADAPVVESEKPQSEESEDKPAEPSVSE